MRERKTKRGCKREKDLKERQKEREENEACVWWKGERFKFFRLTRKISRNIT